MAVKLYLHIGYPKCGSSTIQEALHLNRMALLARGVGVCGEKLELMGKRSIHRFPVGYFLSKAEVVRSGGTVGLRREFEQLARKAARAGLSAVVVSAENLGAVWAAAVVAAAKEFFDCELILYLRRQDDWLLSAWAQWHFKRGESLPAYLARRTARKNSSIYRRTIEAYLDHFPREALSVRLLARKYLIGGDLVTDFWQAIGVEAAGLEPVQSQNVSFSAPLAAALGESPYLFSHGHDNSLTNFIDGYHSHRGAAKKEALSAATRRELLEKFAGENKWLAESFFPDLDLGEWLAVKDTGDEAQNAEIRKRDEPTLRGIAEMVNMNIAVLHSLRRDVDRIKASLGLD